MAINIEALQEAVGKIGAIAQDEFTFDAGDFKVTFRALKSHEEVEVDKYSQIAWDEASGDGDRSALLHYLDRLRVGILSHVIVQIDDVDLRNEYVETGETIQTDTGPMPVRKLQYSVLRDLIWNWPRRMLHLCYLKYGEFVQKLEVRARASIEFDTSDIELEIQRLEKRLVDLKELRGDNDDEEQRQADMEATKNLAQEMGKETQTKVNNLLDARTVQQAQGEARREPPDDAEGEYWVPPVEEGASYPPMRPAATEEEQELMERQRVMPRGAAPPPRPSQAPQAPQQAPPPQAPSVPQTPAESLANHEIDSQGIPRPHEGDSMFDPSDPEAAMAAEIARQRAFRRQTAEERRRQAESASPIPSGKAPPHREALNTRDAVMNLRGEEVTRTTSGQIHGRPQKDSEIQAIRMPTETLDGTSAVRRPSQKQAREAPVNPKSTGSKNPKFRAPGE